MFMKTITVKILLILLVIEFGHL